MKSIIAALAMVALLAGTAAARDQLDGWDYRYGGDTYTIRENQAREQRQEMERKMEDQRQDMQRQMENKRQEMQYQLNQQQQQKW
jgi:uncharacterized protein YpuA (DUF1002 family)